MNTLHLLISGRVQGVGFRWSMCEAAQQFGACGWVRNRRDGRVEAVVDGSAEIIESMLRWARDGPRAARVDRVETRDATTTEIALDRQRFRSTARRLSARYNASSARFRSRHNGSSGSQPTDSRMKPSAT